MADELHVSWSGAGEPVLLVHGSFTPGSRTFAEQASLADEFRLGLVDRRGFGSSPATGRVDFERDAEDIAALLAEPSHLVGHSYGGVACLLAAAHRPEGVRSLTVIEPPALALIAGDQAAETLQTRIAAAFATASDPADLYTRFVQAWGLPRPSVDALARRDAHALAASVGERGPWEAQIPLDVLARARLLTLVVSGGWEDTHPEAQALAGHAFGAVCDVLERRLGAERLHVPGTAHAPQQSGEAFNGPLRAFLRRASRD